MILSFTIILMFSSCLFEPWPKALDDERFNGEFRYSYYYSLDEYRYETYTFNGTNKVEDYVKYEYYDEYSGWHYSGDYPGDHYYFLLEFDVDKTNGLFRKRLWNNEYDDWSDWEKYEFSDDGNLLRLYLGDSYYREFEKIR